MSGFMKIFVKYLYTNQLLYGESKILSLYQVFNIHVYRISKTADCKLIKI